jgi:ATP-dependent Lon protease
VKDLVEIPDNIKNRLEIVPVKWVDQVLDVALERKPEPLAEGSRQAAVQPVPEEKPGASTVVTH